MSQSAAGGETSRLRVAQYLLPEATAALKTRLAQITAAYAQLHEGAPDDPLGQVDRD